MRFIEVSHPCWRSKEKFHGGGSSWQQIVIEMRGGISRAAKYLLSPRDPHVMVSPPVISVCFGSRFWNNTAAGLSKKYCSVGESEGAPCNCSVTTHLDTVFSVVLPPLLLPSGEAEMNIGPGYKTLERSVVWSVWAVV